MMVRKKQLLYMIPLVAALASLALLPMMAAEQHQPKIKGVIESIPAQRTGIWKIGGHAVTVTPQTTFDASECPITVGGQGEARGAYQGQTFVAAKIECEENERDDKDADEGKNEGGDEEQENGQED